MDTSTPDAPEGKRRKRMERLVAWFCVLCVIAALIWRFIWPWTGLRTDLIFIGIFAAGALGMWWLKVFR